VKQQDDRVVTSIVVHATSKGRCPLFPAERSTCLRGKDTCRFSDNPRRLCPQSGTSKCTPVCIYIQQALVEPFVQRDR